MRLIDADALGNRMYHESFEKDSEDQRWDSGCWIRYKLFERVLRDAPTVEPQRIKGRWERKESDLSWWYECSECGESPLFDPYEHEVRTPFCPWCGADMRQQEEQGNVTLN